MFTRALCLAVMALSPLTHALNYSTTGPLTVDLTQYNDTTRSRWCASEMGVCRLICDAPPTSNNCDPENVEGFQCVCPNSMPNISDYAGTIPSIVCGEWQRNCVLNHPMDEPGQQGCLSVKCGSKDAQDNVENSTSSSSATSSPTASTTGSSGGSNTPSSSASSASPTPTDGAATALLIGQSYGTGIVATGLLGLFAFLL